MTNIQKTGYKKNIRGISSAQGDKCTLSVSDQPDSGKH